MPEETLLSLEEFAAKIKEKYPQYKDVDDSTLVAKMLEKYPEYKDRVDLDGESKAVEEEAPLSFPSATVDVSGESETSLQEEEVAEEEVVEEETEDIVTTGETRDYGFGGGFVGENQQMLPKNEEVVVEDPKPITEEESELLEASINPHSMAMSAIGRDPEADVNSLTSEERDVYGRVYSQWQGTQDQQDAVKEREAEKQNNVNRYGIQIEDNSLPGLVPSLSDETTFNPLPGGYNYSDDPEVIAKAETIIELEMSKATNRFQNIFKNPKAYNLPSDITTATPEELTAAWKIFNKQNNKDKDGFFEREREKHVNLKESYLESLFNQQFETSKQQYQDRRDNQITIDKKQEIRNRQGNGEISEEDVKSINLSEHKSYDYDNNMGKDEKAYVDATNKLDEIKKKLSAENLDPELKTELLIEYNSILTDVTAAKIELGGGKEEYLYDVTTGQRVEKVIKSSQEDLTEDVKNKKNEIKKTFKGNVEDAYLEAANREEDHRTWGKQSSRDIEIKDPTYWRLKGYEVVKLDNGNFQVKNVSLSEASVHPSSILNESARNEVLEWKEKNRQNIISREAWKDMALINIDPGKVETEAGIVTKVGTILAGAGTGAVVGGPIGAVIGAGIGAMASTAPDRFFEVLGEETIGKELTEKIGVSDQKFVDVAIEELNKEGIVLSDSQKDNMKRSFGMEFTEAGAGFMPILGKMAIGNKVLGITGAAGWLKTTIETLNKGNRWGKFKGFLLGASVEEGMMQTYGFHDGTGFGFYTAGRFLPAGKIFKFKGEWARLNKVGNTVFETGLKGTTALEFATHVEAIVEDVQGGSEYNEMIREQYPDLSTVGRRVLLNAAVFSFYGAQNLVGRGKSGMNIKNMEASIKELKEKGYTQEAAEIQSQVDLYYEGKKELPKEEQEILTKHENGQLKLEFDTDLTEKELADRLEEMGGKEIKPEAEVKAEVKVEDVKTTSETIESLEREVQKTWEELENTPITKFKKKRELNKKLDELFEKQDKLEAEVKPEAEVKSEKEVKAEEVKEEVKKEEVKETEVTPETNRLESLEKTLDKKQTDTVSLMREKGISKEKVDSYIRNKAKENGKGNKLSEQFKAEDIIANPGKHSEAVVVNAYRLLKGKGGAIDSGGAESSTRAHLKEIKKDIADGRWSGTGDKASVREAYEMMLESKSKPKAEPKVETTDLSELRKKAEAAMKSKIKTVPIKEKKVEETTGKEAKVEETKVDAKEQKLQEEANKKAEETYTPEEIVNTKDPVDVLQQAKNRRKKSTESYIRKKDKLSNTQKQKFREESAKVDKLIKQLEIEIVEKGAKEENGIKEFTDRVVEGLQSAKTRLEKDGLTYSFILPVTPKMLSKALDVGIAAVKKTSSAVIGLNRFKNSIMLQLKIKQLTKKQEKELDDFYNRNRNLTNKDVVGFAKETVKQKRLDIDGFVKEMKKDPMFSKNTKEELEQLYRNSLKELTPKEKAEFTKEAAKETKQTQEQVKKDIKKVEDVSVEPKAVTKQTKDILNNIKDKVTQYNRGISAGKKESKKEVKKIIEEFNDFLKGSGLGKILANKKTLRLTSNVKDAVTLERAVERIEKLVNDKALREESIYRDKVRKKIQAVTSVVESSQGRDVAKQKYRATNANATDKEGKLLTDRLKRINQHIIKSNKSEKYEAEQQEKIENKLEEINDIHSLTFKDKSINKEAQEKNLIELQKELSELEFSQLHNKSTKELEALLKDVQSIELTLSTAKEKQKAEDGVRFNEARKEAMKVLGGGKKLTTGSKKKAPERAQDFWDFVEDNNLQTVFKKLAVRSKGQHFLENFYRKHVKKAEDGEIKDHQEHITKWTNDVAKIFGVKPDKVDIAINELRLEKDSGIELINKEGVKDKLEEITEMQLLAKWMESKDMANKSNLDNMGWTKENLDKLDKFLTPETKLFGVYLFKEYQKSYDKYNETYKKMFGVSMPTAGEFYSPRFIEGKGGKEMNANDVLDNNFNNHVRTANNQHTTKRINNSEPLAYHDASMTFWKYKQAMEKFHHYSNTVRELNAVFGDGKVRDYMREFHGNSYVKVMDYYMDVLSGNFRTKYDAGLGQLVNNLTGGILFLKPAIGIKQTFSTILYGTQMPTRKFIPGLLKFGQGGIVDIKSGTFWKSRDYAYMDVTRSINPRNAYQKGKIRQGVEKLGKKTGTTKVTDQMIMGGVRWTNLMRRFVKPMNSMFIRWGDKVGIGWGGQVYADYQYKQYIKQINKATGKKHTHKEAHDKALNDFEIFAEASQQSSRATNISMIRGTGGDFAKVFTMFQSSQSQVNQIGLMALREMKYKKNVKQNAKTFMAAHVVLGGLFALAGNSFKWDDDKQTWGMIMGNVEGTAGLGKVLGIAKNLALGDKGFKSGLSPVIDNMQSAIGYKLKIMDLKEKSDDARFSLTMKPEERRKKYLEYQEKISENRKKLSLVLLQFGGVPAKGAVNLYEDIGTVYRNESENPIREILGFESDWTVGRELYDISEEGFMNPTEDDRKLHQLKREQKRLETKISKSYLSERDKFQAEFDSNAKKIEKLLNKK